MHGQMRNALLKKYRNEIVLDKLRKKLLGFVAVLLVVFAMFTMLLFYLSERRAYQGYMKESNEVTAGQVASIYELYLQNIKEIAYDTVYNNSELLRLSAEERGELNAKRDILNLLDSVSVMNPYIHSVYLYYEEDEMVYSSISMPYAVVRLSYFGDREVFGENTAVTKPYLVGPHLLHSTAAISDPKEQPLVMSYIVPVAEPNGTVFLCVNANTRSLYSMILRNFELEQNRNFYIVDENGYVVFHRNPDYLFVEEVDLPQEEGMIRSEAYSGIMDMTFVFESTVPPLESEIGRYALRVLAVLGVALLAMTVIIVYSTLPVHKMVQVAKKSNLRDFLAGLNGSIDTSFWDQSMQKCTNHVIAVFRILLPEYTEEFLNHGIKIFSQNEEDYHFLALKMTEETVAVIFGNIQSFDEVQFRRRVQSQCENMCSIIKNGVKVSCVVSRVTEGLQQLQKGYQECCETFRYQYLFPHQVIAWEAIDRTLPGYPFPVRHERHIINNLLAGNEEECMHHIDAVFSDFRSGNYLIQDKEINRYLAVMQENISLRLENLSIPMERLERNSFDTCVTLEELYTVFAGYIHELLVQITSRPCETEDGMNHRVMEYIERNFCQNDICLSKIAEELSLSSSAISRIVKETSHRNFSEYITYKRIQRSKELLAEGTMSINAVSEAVGFSYPYYFIRKFKELEGVTPGQYIGTQEKTK